MYFQLISEPFAPRAPLRYFLYICESCLRTTANPEKPGSSYCFLKPYIQCVSVLPGVNETISSCCMTVPDLECKTILPLQAVEDRIFPKPLEASLEAATKLSRDAVQAAAVSLNLQCAHQAAKKAPKSKLRRLQLLEKQKKETLHTHNLLTSQ